MDLVCIDAKYLPEEFQTAWLSNNGFTGVSLKWEQDEKKLQTRFEKMRKILRIAIERGKLLCLPLETVQLVSR